jgi:hypothetical protein
VRGSASVFVGHRSVWEGGVSTCRKPSAVVGCECGVSMGVGSREVYVEMGGYVDK